MNLTDTMFLVVVSADLQCLIDGGSGLSVTHNQQVTLDAVRFSLDPDIEDTSANNQTISYSWSCKSGNVSLHAAVLAYQSTHAYLNMHVIITEATLS